MLAETRPDILLLTGIDWDHDLVALSALADRVAKSGPAYPHRFATRPNTGMATGLDLDGNGRLGEARDAQGYGRFTGEGGMAILSRLPIGPDPRDFTGLLWRDLPGAILPDGMAEDVAAVQRLSTTAHWDVPVILPGGRALRLLAWHASPPVFDGPEDRNGRRNHDEAALWLRLLDGTLAPPPAAPFVILGDANLDLADGDGRPGALQALLDHPALQDPAPRHAAGPPPRRGRGDPALATADFTARDGPGWLRVDYILPSRDLEVTGSGVFWPPADAPPRAAVDRASRHRLVWVDVKIAAP